jgi:high frequency lysogenization protein
MPYTNTDRTIALAGLYQATRLVQQIANTGNIDEQDFTTSINSIFKVDVEQATDAYDDATQPHSSQYSNLHTGLRTLIEQLGGAKATTMNNRGKNLNITKYAIGIMILERKLRKTPGMLQYIADGIKRVRDQQQHFANSREDTKEKIHDSVVAGLANIYSETISTLRPRIMVQGEHVYIANPTQANRIRALLLAAIRAAVLWRQCAGTRWQLLLKRRQVLDEAQRLLNGAA